MQKRLLSIFLMVLISLYPVYSLSLFPNKDNNILTLNIVDLKEVRYSNHILELVLESNSNIKIDGIIVNINNNDNIVINEELNSYSTKIYQINTKETPDIIQIQFYNDNKHNRNIFNQDITYRITGNEKNIIEQPEQIIVQDNQQLQLQFNQRPSYISYSSYSKIDDNKNIIYFTKDIINSNKISTNQQGNIEFKANYMPYGEVFHQEGNGNYKFSSKELDSSNLYYFGARYYNSNIGRFTQVDPIYKASESPYMYANNNPIKYVDPTGKAAEEATPLEMVGYQVGFSATLPLIRGLIRGDSVGDIAKNTLWGAISGLGSGGLATLAGSHASSNLDFLAIRLGNNLFNSIETNAMRNDPPLRELTFDYTLFSLVLTRDKYSKDKLNFGLNVPRSLDVARIGFMEGNRFDLGRTLGSGEVTFTRENFGKIGDAQYAGITGSLAGGAIAFNTNSIDAGLTLQHEIIHTLDHQTIGAVGRGFNDYSRNGAPTLLGLRFYGLGNFVGNSLLVGTPTVASKMGGISNKDLYNSDASWWERRAYTFTKEQGR